MSITKTAYTLLCKKTMSVGHATFIRVEPANLQITLGEIYRSLADISWINRLPNVRQIIRNSFLQRANNSLPGLYKLLVSGSSGTLVSDAKQYVVSELGRGAVVNEMGYLDIPLAELLRIQKSGNPGFDFYSESTSEIILFGEAKYVGAQNGFGRALGQIEEFIRDGKDLMDVADLEHFCSSNAMDNMEKGEKGFIAAFSARNISDADLEAHIEQNQSFKNLLAYKELVCVAVNI